jgi:uncharacterized damage-inducible protein DinB
MSNRLPVLARYNAWANHKLYAAVEALTDEQFRADRGVFFKSLHGTLNHLLATDRIWMGRFTGKPEPGLRLDSILHDSFDALHAARQAEDTRIISYVDGLDDKALTGSFSYQRASTAERYAGELGPALDHLFNHQTHHRGQAHAVLTGFGAEAPSLDLSGFYREVGFGGLIRIA